MVHVMGSTRSNHLLGGPFREPLLKPTHTQVRLAASLSRPSVCMGGAISLTPSLGPEPRDNLARNRQKPVDANETFSRVPMQSRRAAVGHLALRSFGALRASKRKEPAQHSAVRTKMCRALRVACCCCGTTALFNGFLKLFSFLIIIMKDPALSLA